MSGSEREREEQRKPEEMQNLPPTPESHPQDEFSAEGSESSAASDRRRYQRGGRKKSTSAREPRKSRIGPVPEPEGQDEDEQYEEAERALIQDEPDEPIGEEEHDDPEEGYYEEGEEEEEEQEAASPKNETLCSKCAAKTQQPEQQQQKAPSPFETGIKAFNLKRAEASGGRPIGVRATPNTSGKKSTDSKKSKKTKKSRKAKVESDSEEEGSDDSFEEQKQKPMSIRLDLNLMVEIFLKAKIKGDVTITFL
ncbi:uncharacterized protein LY89DRAFT_358474 [Mollisia scopiformis]|uniref:Uncharacterized protein n=1 Tax=Mollisia scopiformis TaxID=149040 RepID=A0A132B585_MOLSC|nr:uncharacterized protein LY89DRAFT_358474 [Mollisia scopiformis]KUJ07576.1 hypothetical protein LY89DRAFT_358474 [Mollisia scopiformis]